MLILSCWGKIISCLLHSKLVTISLCILIISYYEFTFLFIFINCSLLKLNTFKVNFKTRYYYVTPGHYHAMFRFMILSVLLLYLWLSIYTTYVNNLVLFKLCCDPLCIWGRRRMSSSLASRRVCIFCLSIFCWLVFYTKKDSGNARTHSYTQCLIHEWTANAYECNPFTTIRYEVVHCSNDRPNKIIIVLLPPPVQNDWIWCSYPPSVPLNKNENNICIFFAPYALRRVYDLVVYPDDVV